MTARPTLVFIRHHEIGARVFPHGSELEPDLLTQDDINKLIDKGVLKEYDSSERRSLFRLFPTFSDCKETESLTDDELKAYTLP